ncbi:MAG: HesA/MoeB/ThiF family protein [Porticoccaceae bacterium]|nr:HesA/MoeB/ThiF family protein [Porticoccaceae bacterium]
MPLSGRDFIRYSRHLLLVDMGEAGQEQLLQARVLIVGLGGLGCPVALYLAAAGVGHLSLCDGDSVELTNLQRQILYRDDDCGKAKVVCGREHLLALNPGLDIQAFQQQANDNLWANNDYDLVLDCTDNLEARHWLNRQCLQTQTPLVSAAAMGWQGQLVSFDFRQQQSPCLACAIPEGSPAPVANCANSGVVGSVLGTMGSLQATATIKALTGKPINHGRMQRYDGLRDQWSSFNIVVNPACAVCQGEKH